MTAEELIIDFNNHVTVPQSVIMRVLVHLHRLVLAGIVVSLFQVWISPAVGSILSHAPGLTLDSSKITVEWEAVNRG